MYQETTRALSEGERERLQATVAGFDAVKPGVLVGTAVLWLLALAACGSGFALCFTLISSSLISGGLALPLAIGGILCLAQLIKVCGRLLALQDLEQQIKRREAPAVEAALRDGRARVQRVEAAAVVELTVEEDGEGSIYAFDVGDRHTLVVDAADWPTPDGPWPNSRFELVRAEHGDRVVAVYCRGQLLRPLRVIRFEDCHEDFAWPDELAPLVPRSLEDFVRATRV